MLIQKKTFVALALVLGLLIAMTACASNGTGLPKYDAAKYPDVPKEVMEFALTYLETVKNEGFKVAVDYCYFAKKINKTFYTSDDNVSLKDYNIDSVEKINENLYAAVITYGLSYGEADDPPSEDTGFNFVGKIDGEWRLMTNKRNIPEDIKENFDPLKYEYDDPNILNSDNMVTEGLIVS